MATLFAELRRNKNPIMLNARLFLMICLLTALSAICGLATAGQTPSKQLDIRVGAYENYPKVYSDQDGNIVGFFPEILHHIASVEGWNIEYVPGNWSQSLARLGKNEIDLMVDVALSEERSKQYDFTSETVLINWGILYTRKNFRIESLFDLRGKTIAVMKDSIHTVGKEGIKNLLKKFNSLFIVSDSVLFPYFSRNLSGVNPFNESCGLCRL